MTPPPIRVLIAEDIYIMRMCLKALLAPFEDICVDAEAADGFQALETAKSEQPDVALVDLSMPNMDGVEAIASIKEACPDVRVLALTAHMDAELIRKTYAAGADGYLIKNVTREELARAIRLAADGRPYISEQVACLLLDSYPASQKVENPAPELGQDEMRMLACMAAGLTQSQTASELDIAVDALPAMEASLRSKFQAPTTAQALVYAIEKGLARCAPHSSSA